MTYDEQRLRDAELCNHHFPLWTILNEGPVPRLKKLNFCKEFYQKRVRRTQKFVLPKTPSMYDLD